MTPMPGTRLRERLKQENRLLPLSWDYYTCNDVTFIPKKISVDKLQEGLLDIHKNIYDKRVVLDNAYYFKKIYSQMIKNANSQKV